MADHPVGPGGQAPRLDASGPREVVFCHQCENEWYKDQGGLLCPRCEGEITEIVTPESDPRPERHTPPPPSGPRRIYPPTIRGNDRPDRNYRLDNDSDPEEADIEEHIAHGPGGSVLFSRTVRTSSPRSQFGAPPRRGGDPHNEDPDLVMRGFQDMIGNLMGPQFRPGQAGRSGSNTLFTQGNGSSAQTFRSGGDGNGPSIMGARYTFGGPVPRQQPRDEDFYGAPQPGGPPPVPDLATIIGSLFGPMGPPGQREAPAGFPHGLQGLFSAMLNPANARSGDAVYTQEALDQIISQLMEQHPTSNAPGPASPDAISALPKKKLDEKELGPEGKGECSVCMDDVTIGVEVVMLPCSHWFHEACASAWLSEHNTCPICRKGIEGETPLPNSRRSSQGAQPTRNEHRARRMSSIRPRMDRWSTAGRNEARLESIRNSAGMQQTEDRDRFPDRDTPQPRSEDYTPPVPGSFYRRQSEMSENQRDNRRGNTSGSDRSRESRRSSHSGNSTTGGVTGWLRDRFGGGGNRRAD